MLSEGSDLLDWPRSRRAANEPLLVLKPGAREYQTGSGLNLQRSATFNRPRKSFAREFRFCKVNGRNTRKSRELYRLPYLTKNLTKFSFYSIYHLLSATYRKSGGEGGIRTPGTLASTSDFESGAFNHSATSPTLFEALRCRCKRAGVHRALLPALRQRPGPEHGPEHGPLIVA